MNRVARIFQPDLMVESVADIDPKLFSRNNIKGILIDIDGTLSPFGKSFIDSENKEWIQKVRQQIPVQCLTFNHERKNLCQIANEIGHQPLQRRILEHPTDFFGRAARTLEIEPKRIVVINDSLISLSFAFTLGFQRIKVSTIPGDFHFSPIGITEYFGQWAERTFFTHFLLPRS